MSTKRNANEMSALCVLTFVISLTELAVRMRVDATVGQLSVAILNTLGRPRLLLIGGKFYRSIQILYTWILHSNCYVATDRKKSYNYSFTPVYIHGNSG